MVTTKATEDFMMLDEEVEDEEDEDEEEEVKGTEEVEDWKKEKEKEKEKEKLSRVFVCFESSAVESGMIGWADWQLMSGA